MFIEEYIELLLKKHSIPEEDKELYIFGIRQGAFMLVNIITTFVLGFLLGMFWQCLVFFVVYTSLRMYAGGAHAKTQLMCYILSTLLTLTVLLLVKFMPRYAWSTLLILFSSGLIVYLLAPVQSINKPLSSKEIVVYKKRVRILLYIFILLALILLALGHYLFAVTITVSIGALSFMLLIGKITERKTNQ